MRNAVDSPCIGAASCWSMSTSVEQGNEHGQTSAYILIRSPHYNYDVGSVQWSLPATARLQSLTLRMAGAMGARIALCHFKSLYQAFSAPTDVGTGMNVCVHAIIELELLLTHSLTQSISLTSTSRPLAPI